MATASITLESLNARVDRNRPNESTYNASATGSSQAILADFFDNTQLQSIRYNRLISATPQIWVSNSGSSSTVRLKGHALTNRFSYQSVTWNTKPATSGTYETSFSLAGSELAQFNITDFENVLNAALYGFQFDGVDNATLSLAYAQLIHDLEMKLYYDTTPISFNVSVDTVPLYRYAASKVTWTADPTSTDSYYQVAQASAKVQWRTGSSGTINTINVPSGTKQVTIPANTFSTSSVQIRVEVTGNNGAVATSSWKTLTVQGASLVNAAPQTGYINETVSNQFSWNLLQLGAEVYIPQESATFQYKYSSSGAVTEVAVTTAKNVTIPANTFTGDTVIWRVIATPTGGTAITSPWYTLTTVEVTSTAAAISPVNEAVDGSAPITFRWAHIIATGTPQKKYDLQYSTNGTSWSSLSSSTTANTYYTAAAGRFTSGTYYWRVRTYNSDNIAGAWSDPVQIIVIAAPGTPSLNVTSATPKWSIRWSQDGQQGYEIEFDGKVIYSGFGTATTYTFDGLADDGEHTVRVRVQNLYSLWSPWASATFSIVNDPPRTLTLTAALSSDAPAVNLTISGSYSGYAHWIYRNGKLIAKTTATSFTDNFVNGDAVYTVRGLATSGVNYSVSNEATVSVAPTIPWIYSLKSGWIPLRMSTAETNAATQTYASAAAFLHFAGAPRPFVEFGEAVDRTLSFAVGFLNGSTEQAAFLAAVGGMACLKLPDGDVIIGALTGWNRTHGRIYTEYSATITEAEFDEVSANG